MRLGAILLAAVMAIGCADVNAARSTPLSQDFVNSVRPLMMDGSLRCTASLIDAKRGYWLTAAHCNFEDAEFTIDGKEATWVMIDPVTDLMVMQTAPSELKALRLSSVAPVRGTHIRAYGYAVGYDGDLFTGYVSNPSGMIPGDDVERMRYDMTGCGGVSGSSVVDDDGRVVSVAQFGHGRPCDGFSGGATYDNLRQQVSPYFG